MNVIDELEEAINREMKPVIAERDALFDDNARLSRALEHIRDNGHWLGLYSIHKIAVEALTGNPFYSPAAKAEK